MLPIELSLLALISWLVQIFVNIVFFVYLPLNNDSCVVCVCVNSLAILVVAIEIYFKSDFVAENSIKINKSAASNFDNGIAIIAVITGIGAYRQPFRFAKLSGCSCCRAVCKQ